MHHVPSGISETRVELVLEPDEVREAVVLDVMDHAADVGDLHLRHCSTIAGRRQKGMKHSERDLDSPTRENMVLHLLVLTGQSRVGRHAARARCSIALRTPAGTAAGRRFRRSALGSIAWRGPRRSSPTRRDRLWVRSRKIGPAERADATMPAETQCNCVCWPCRRRGTARSCVSTPPGAIRFSVRRTAGWCGR